MGPFQPGTPVCWGDKYYGRYVRLIDDRYSLVEDGTGKPPRIIRTERLKRGTELDLTPKLAGDVA